MKSIRYILCGVFFIGCVFALTSCEKYLDEAPDKSRVIITKLSDLQAILDDPMLTNSYRSLTTGGADEYYFSQSSYDNLTSNYRDAYTWEERTDVDAWTTVYKTIFQANVVIEHVGKLDGTESEKRNIMAQALFHRAFAFFEIAQVYCSPYHSSTLDEPGIVLKLIPDVESRSTRSTVKETYDKILSDLQAALPVAQESLSTSNRPYLGSVLGMLARVYLSMGDYENAEKYADLFLEKYPGLTNFNTLDPYANPAFSHLDEEVHFYAYSEDELPGYSSIVDSNLLRSYLPGDLRKTVYFFDQGDGTYTFKGSYTGIVGALPFHGIVTDEIYLIRAECRARLNNRAGALIDLNTLLESRWEAGKFVPVTAGSDDEALSVILWERWKELVFRGTRWSDIRRLNLEGRNIELIRYVNGERVVLPPNDERFTWLIPNRVILLSNMQQNKR